MRKICLVMFLFIGIAIVSSGLLNTSFAYFYDIDNSVLFYKENNEELEEDIKVYLSYIDDYLITNSSYLYGDKLSDNYDFLVNFALDFVLNNREYYEEYIIERSNCDYINKYGISNSTNSYVELEEIYKLTDKYFGIRDFSVINDNVCIDNSYISLSDYDDKSFDYEISNVVVNINNSDIIALVDYENGNSFLYSFYNDHNVLKLVNVEVIV